MRGGSDDGSIIAATSTPARLVPLDPEGNWLRAEPSPFQESRMDLRPPEPTVVLLTHRSPSSTTLSTRLLSVVVLAQGL